MVTFRSNNPGQQPGARPSVAGERVARKAPDPETKPLEPADSFDLGEEAPSAEEVAGMWLGRKAAARTKKKKAAADAAKPAAKKPATEKPAADSAVENGGTEGTPSESTSPEADDKAQGKRGRRSAGARPSRKGAVAKAKPKANRKKVLAIVGAAAVAVLVACAVAAGLWAWNEWYRYDDAADIQGEWATSDGSAIVVIDSETMHMPDSVDFPYALDTKSKTIAYAFGDLQGGGSYVFSDDRSTLTITEADGSLTVFVKRSSDATGTPRVLSAGESASSSAQGEASAADGAADSSADAAGASESGAAVAPEPTEQEAAEVADALSSTSSEATPGANAVAPGSNAAGA